VNQHINYLFYSTKKKDIKGQAQRLALLLFFLFLLREQTMSRPMIKKKWLIVCLPNFPQSSGWKISKNSLLVFLNQTTYFSIDILPENT
jgi:hypothetical protein